MGDAATDNFEWATSASSVARGREATGHFVRRSILLLYAGPGVLRLHHFLPEAHRGHGKNDGKPHILQLAGHASHVSSK